MPRSATKVIPNGDKSVPKVFPAIDETIESGLQTVNSDRRSRKRVIEDADTPTKRAKRSTATVKPAYNEEPDTGEKAKHRISLQPSIALQTTTDSNSGKVAPSNTHNKTHKETPKSSPKALKATIKAKKSLVKQEVAGPGEDTQKIKRHRKTKEEKEAEAMPLAARTTGIKLMIGAHVSAAGGVQNAITNAVRIGGNSMALFLKSQRKWANPPLTPATTSLFHGEIAKHTYDPATQILPHGSYLVNLAQPDPTKAAQAYTSFLDDLQRCEALHIGLYNFHPGNTCGAPRAAATARLAAQLNVAHAATPRVVTLLENMAAASATSNVLGGRFEDLGAVIAGVTDKARVGVTLDTCHAFAAGYDLRTPAALAATLAEFDAVVGRRFLRAWHLNDSKAPLGSGRDLHQSIGRGFLGLRAFHALVNEESLAGVPMVLETPVREGEDEGAVYAKEIKLLESLVGMDPEGEEFKRLERELAEAGREEREKFLAAAEKRAAKGAGKGKRKGKRGGKEDSAESDSDSESD